MQCLHSPEEGVRSPVVKAARRVLGIERGSSGRATSSQVLSHLASPLAFIVGQVETVCLSLAGVHLHSLSRLASFKRTGAKEIKEIGEEVGHLSSKNREGLEHLHKDSLDGEDKKLSATSYKVKERTRFEFLVLNESLSAPFNQST